MDENNHILQTFESIKLVDSNKTNGTIQVTEEEENVGKHNESGSSERDMWSSKTEFLLSCIGYAVGLGNIWRFPYLCYRSGGGAFLIPYLLMLLFCGIPLYFIEMGIGQFSSVGCIGIFRLAPFLKGTGFAILVINFICTCYCSVIISYPLLFIRKIFQPTLPWLTCKNIWNTEHCVDLQELGQHNFTRNSTKMAADEFFHNEILQISSGIEELGGIVWPLFWCLFITCMVIYICINRGIKSVGKVVYFSATFPFFVLIVLFIRGITLPGAMDGIIFYIKPKWSSLLDLKVWTDAALQIFFSLGPGWGSLVNMASFNSFRNNIQKDVYLVPIINCSTSIFAGFVVFSVLGYLSHQTGVPVESVATNGPGLVFITYPQAIAMLPLPHLWAGLFFIMLFLLGLDTVFVQLETMATCILDEIPKLRKYSFAVPIFLCVSVFLASIVIVTRGGIYVLQLLDWYSSLYTLLCICLLEVTMIAWIYGVDNFLNDIAFMIGEKPAFFWKYCLKYVLPVILIGLFFTSIASQGNVTYNGIVYPNWAIILGWLSCAASIVCIPLYMIYMIFGKNGSLCLNLQRSLQSVDWRPANRSFRIEYENFKKATFHQLNHDIRRT